MEELKCVFCHARGNVGLRTVCAKCYHRKEREQFEKGKVVAFQSILKSCGTMACFLCPFHVVEDSSHILECKIKQALNVVLK